MSFTLKKEIKESTLSSFDELMVANNTPVLQVSAQYGITDDTLVASLGGGSTSSSNSLFVADTGTSANGVAAVLSNREVAYRSGQGIRCIYSSIFNDGVANSTQQSGLLTSESAFGFGFDGERFGIFHARGGALEIQELHITTAATGNETATITVDDEIFNVPLTAGTQEQNAYQVSIYLSDNDPRYRYTSNGNIVTVLARLPEQGSGLWVFSSSTAVAGFIEIENGAVPPETWVYKEDWNVKNDLDINPSLGNVYMIQYSYTGFDGIKFFMKNPDTDHFELVHIIKYTNTTTEVSADNPTFRVGWACRNTGNTTSVKVRGSSAAAFIEGERFIDTSGKGKCNISNISSGNDVNILSFRNRDVFNGKANRADAFINELNVATEASKITLFKIIKNPTVNTYLDFEYFNNGSSLLEFATNNTIVTGGEEIACYATTSDIIDSLESLLGYITPGDIYSITANFSSGAASDVLASINWKDDF